ncbi:hypothetical protein JCM10450v2_006945 [Rhodotorula kratochvilovae]
MPPSPSRAASAGRKGDDRDALKKAAHRFREQRSKILRLLGQSAHSFGADFAILWVAPEGQAEVYASEALQGRLRTWLDDAVQRDAEDCVRRDREEKERRRMEGLQVLGGSQVFGAQGQVVNPAAGPEAMDCGGDGGDGAAVEGRSSSDADDFLLPVPPSGPSASDDALPTPTRVASTSNDYHQDLSSPAQPRQPLGPPAARLSRSLATNNLSASQLSPHLAASPIPSPLLPPSAFPSSPYPPAASAPPAPAKLVRRTFTPDELEQWYRDRLNELWHKVDKIVCKTWIKTVEPNKQSRYQYQKGDEHKPGWWPREIRHKEPDHLNKPERVALLMHILRNGPVSIEELELATAAVSAHIPTEKMSILHEIYRIAKEEKAAIEQSSDGTFAELTVALEVVTNKAEEQLSPAADEPKLHNTRHRARRSIGQQPAELSAPQLSPAAARVPSPLQQTPRAANRLQPYPLSRSHSHSDVHAEAGPSRSPAPPPPSASAGMSRSQSLAGPVTSAGRPRHVSGSRREIKGALEEADLLGAEAVDATPYGAGRPHVTPGRGGEQGSPLAPQAASMGRSFSTSAVGGGGAGGSAGKKARAIDDAVASPAMLKSRSRLSQQHFDQMVLGASSAEKQQRRAVAAQQQQQHFPVVYEQPHAHEMPPQFQLHQHHQQQLAQLQAQAQAQQHLPPPPRPPLHHAHSQPLPHPHQRVPSHPQHPHPDQGHLPALPPAPPGQILVYGPFPNQSAPALPHPPPQLVRQLSAHAGMHPSHGHPQMHPHHHHQQQHPSPVLPQHAGFSPSPHLPQLPQLPQLPHGHGHPHGHAPMHAHQQQQGHALAHGHPHPHPHPQTQVQVQVQVHAAQHHHTRAPQPQGDFDAYGPTSGGTSGAGGSYPTPTTGTYASPHFAHASAGGGSGPASPFLGGGGGGGSGGGTPHSQPPLSAGTQDGFLSVGGGGAAGLDGYAGEYGAGAEDWQAYATPLEGLGLGVEATMAFEPGYYGGEGEDEFGLLGSLGGDAEEQLRREKDEARRRYEEHAFGQVVGA